MSPGSVTMSSTPEMVDSVNVLNLIDRRIAIEDIYVQLTIGAEHKIVLDDLHFLRLVFVEFPLDNARPHTTARTVETTDNCCHILFQSRRCSLLFLFVLSLKVFLGGKKSFQSITK